MAIYIPDIWFWILGSVVLLNLLLYLVWFGRLVFHKNHPLTETGNLPPVSIIVAARNEIKNLQLLMPKLLELDYPNYEIIVVDDHSWDGTHDQLLAWQDENTNFSFVSLGDNVANKQGKKLALTLGIKKAKNEILVFTDADCVPSSPQWLRWMVSSYSTDTEIVIGYSPDNANGGILQSFIRYETFFVGWQYLSAALFKRAYMGVGRNLSYKKTTWVKQKGFAAHLSVPYGDDDLFVQQASNQSNTRIVANPDSHVFTIPKPTAKAWMRQKQRHLSAGELYKGNVKIMLAFSWVLHLLFYLTTVLYFVFGELQVAVLGLIAFRILAVWIFSFVLNYKFKMFSIWYLQPLLDFCYQSFIYPITGVITILNPQKNRW